MFKLKLFFALAALPALCFGVLDLSDDEELNLQLSKLAGIYWFKPDIYVRQEPMRMPSAADFNKKVFTKKSTGETFFRPKLKISKTGIFANKSVNMPKPFELYKRKKKRTDVRKSALEKAKKAAEVFSVDIDKNKEGLDGAVYLLAFAKSGVGKK